MIYLEPREQSGIPCDVIKPRITKGKIEFIRALFCFREIIND